MNASGCRSGACEVTDIFPVYTSSRAALLKKQPCYTCLSCYKRTTDNAHEKIMVLVAHRRVSGSGGRSVLFARLNTRVHVDAPSLFRTQTFFSYRRCLAR